MKRRNPVARLVRTTRFRPQVVQAKTKQLPRKAKHKKREQHD